MLDATDGKSENAVEVIQHVDWHRDERKYPTPRRCKETQQLHIEAHRDPEGHGDGYARKWGPASDQ